MAAVIDHAHGHPGIRIYIRRLHKSVYFRVVILIIHNLLPCGIDHYQRQMRGEIIAHDKILRNFSVAYRRIRLLG